MKNDKVAYDAVHHRTGISTSLDHGAHLPEWLLTAGCNTEERAVSFQECRFLTGSWSVETLRSLLSGLIVAFLALRSLLPVGFMPGVSTEGVMTIFICDASGGRHLAVDRNGEPTPAAPGGEGRTSADAGLCTQLSTSWAATPVGFTEVILPFAIARSLTLVPRPDALASADPLGSNSARGPPAAAA